MRGYFGIGMLCKLTLYLWLANGIKHKKVTPQKRVYIYQCMNTVMWKKCICCRFNYYVRSNTKRRNSLVADLYEQKGLIWGVIQKLQYNKRDFTEDDLFQEGYIALMNISKSYVPRGAKFSTVATIAIHNHLCNYLRNESRRRCERATNNVLRKMYVKYEEETHYETILREQLKRLKPHYRDIIKKVFYEECSLRDIARERGVSDQAISQQYHRAIDLLREKIVKQLPKCL